MIQSVIQNKLIVRLCLIIITSLVNTLPMNAQVLREKNIGQSESYSAKNKLKLPTPPQTGTPKGNKTPGATRPENLCPQNNQPLTALVANNSKDYTLSAYPTFWFYIPYQPSAIKYLEFALKNPQTNTTVYRTAIKPQNNSGIINVNIPQEEKFALQNGNNYIFELILSCEGNESYESDVMVNGWIKKLAMNNELQAQITQISPLEAYQFYLNNEVWYDAINQIAQLYFNNSDNPRLKQEWLDLLELLQQQQLSQEVFVESVLSTADL